MTSPLLGHSNQFQHKWNITALDFFFWPDTRNQFLRSLQFVLKMHFYMAKLTCVHFVKDDPSVGEIKSWSREQWQIDAHPHFLSARKAQPYGLARSVEGPSEATYWEVLMSLSLVCCVSLSSKHFLWVPVTSCNRTLRLGLLTVDISL